MTLRLTPFAMKAIRLIKADDGAGLASLLDDTHRGEIHIDRIWPSGKTFFTLACSVGSGSCATALLGAGADPDLADGNGSWPLDLALKAQSLECCRAILARSKRSPSNSSDRSLDRLDKADPFQAQVHALSMASILRSICSLRGVDLDHDVARLLTCEGIIDEPNELGQSALGIAASLGNAKACETLNGLGACIEGPPGAKMTPIDWASACRQHETAQYLKSRLLAQQEKAQLSSEISDSSSIKARFKPL